MKIELSIEKITSGELSGAYRVSAWSDGQYLGNQSYLWYTKREALHLARESVKNSGGLGIWANR